MNSIFITGTGTGVGKTIAAAIVAEALQADYWKPIQAGFSESTDTELVQSLITNKITKIHPELYKFKLAASPHLAAKAEGIIISTDEIFNHYCLRKESFGQLSTANCQLPTANCQLIIEGAGGLLVPLNENEFVIDLIKKLKIKVILVSRNYLGSINHSLLTASVCKANNIDVLGWLFNDEYMNYENEIVQWSGYKKIASIPFTNEIDKLFIQKQAARIKKNLIEMLCIRHGDSAIIKKT